MSELGRPVSIAIDAMGGYRGLAATVAAVAEASTRGNHAVFFTLVGDEGLVSEELWRHGHNPERISVCHSPSAIGMDEPPNAALEAKPNASIRLACALVAQGEADAVISAGHPGATILASLQSFNRLSGVRKTALASVYPTPRVRGPNGDRFALILDVGATLRAQPEDLLGFALMGSAYSRIVKGLDRPRVALLSNSREASIGPPEVVAAYELLRDHPDINFFGVVEGNEIPRGEFDVIVCEGFVGDVALKILEGAGEAAMELARSAYERRLAWRLGLKLLSGGIGRLKSAIEFEEYGGAPLLGLDQTIILAHPESGKKAIANALKLAIKNVRADLPSEIQNALSPQA